MPALFGKGNRKAYRQIYQTDSDISDTDEDEKVIFRQPSDLELKLVPDHGVKSSRKKVEAKARCRKIFILTGVVLVVMVVAVSIFAKLRHHNPALEMPCETCDWHVTLNEYIVENGIQLLDVDGDGKDDIVFGVAVTKAAELLMNLRSTNNSYSFLHDLCQKIGKEYPCTGMVFALRGYDGKELWRLPVRGIFFNLNCDEFDLDLDGKVDCIGTGRMGAVVAFNPYTGARLWMAESDSHLRAGWNTYQARPLPDWDGDRVPEVLIVNGGDPAKDPKDHNRASGRLMILSGASGKPLGDGYLNIPGDKETYMSPVMYRQTNSSPEYILFGSGGETVPGDFLGISVADFCRYILGPDFSRCPPADNLTWSNLQKDEHGIFVIYKGQHKGVMVPPVVVDVNHDGVMDVVVSAFDGAVVLLDGTSMMPLWTANFTGLESYTTPAPGYFDDDEVLDFMVHWNVGNWDDRYNQSVAVVLSGKTGEELWRSGSVADIQASDLVISTNHTNHDLYVFRRNKMAYPKQEQVPRSRRHGGGHVKPAGGSHMGSGSPTEGIAQVQEYYTQCSALNEPHTEEVLLLDRSSVNSPMKILELSPTEYYYMPKQIGDDNEDDDDDGDDGEDFDGPEDGTFVQDPEQGEQEEDLDDHHVQLHTNTDDTVDDDTVDDHSHEDNDNHESSDDNRENVDVNHESDQNNNDVENNNINDIHESDENNNDIHEDDNRNDANTNDNENVNDNKGNNNASDPDDDSGSPKQDLDKDHTKPDGNQQNLKHGREGAGITTTTTTTTSNRDNQAAAGREGEKKSGSEGGGTSEEGGERSPRATRGGRSSSHDVQPFCSYSQPDVGATGALGDVDGDGLLDYISVVKYQAKIYDSFYSQTGFHDYTVVNKVSLEKQVHGNHGNKLQVVDVGAETSLKSNVGSSGGFKSVPAFLPLRLQKWTKYMGTKGNNWFT